MDILHDTVPFGAILPAWTHFYLFLGHYLRDELAEARFHAGQMTSGTHIYGQLARALVAHRDGRAEEARSTVEAILSSEPHWKADARREIGKLVTAIGIADRLARDFAAAWAHIGARKRKFTPPCRACERLAVYRKFLPIRRCVTHCFPQRQSAQSPH